MQLEIIGKLNKYFESHSVGKEDEIVYVMVELRKLLDRIGDRGEFKKYPLIRFYSDWVVHTEKDVISPAMKNVLQQIEKRLNPHPQDDDIRFLLLPEYRNEMIMLFDEYSLMGSFLEPKKWKKFVITLTQVLADQPMVNPTNKIKEFRYITQDKDHLSVNIDFNNGSGITMVIAANMLQ